VNVAVNVVEAVVSVVLLGVVVTVYPVIGEPPVLVGADHVTVASAQSTSTLVIVGAPGAAYGVAAIVLLLALAPAALTACMDIVYTWPLVSPVIEADVAEELAVTDILEAFAVAVTRKLVMAAPPLFPAIHVAVICESAAVADTSVGGFGTVYGITAEDGEDAVPGTPPTIAAHVNV
jgi:hypothetical protein